MDVKNLLYTEIDHMGTQNIRRKITENTENSKYIIEQIMKNCFKTLDKINISSYDRISLAEALTHYMLTNMLLPTQRKINFDGFEVSIVIPNARNMIKNLKETLIIQFYTSENDLKTILDHLVALQPLRQNIWIVSYLPINYSIPIKNYVILYQKNKDNKLVLPFSHLLIDIAEYVQQINYSGFKIL